MTKKTLAFIFLAVLILTALCYWHPNTFLFSALYPGIVAGLSVSNVHWGSSSPIQTRIRLSEAIVNFLVYSAVVSLFLRPRNIFELTLCLLRMCAQ